MLEVTVIGLLEVTEGIMNFINNEPIIMLPIAFGIILMAIKINVNMLDFDNGDYLLSSYIEKTSTEDNTVEVDEDNIVENYVRYKDGTFKHEMKNRDEPFGNWVSYYEEDILKVKCKYCDSLISTDNEVCPICNASNYK